MQSLVSQLPISPKSTRSYIPAIANLWTSALRSSSNHASAELLAGLALVLGVYAHQVSLALVPIMAAAAWVHFPNGWVHTSPNGGCEYPVFLIAALLAVWLLGDGALTLKRSPLFAPGGT